jgi:hypothetical protein
MRTQVLSLCAFTQVALKSRQHLLVDELKLVEDALRFDAMVTVRECPWPQSLFAWNAAKSFTVLPYLGFWMCMGADSDIVERSAGGIHERSDGRSPERRAGRIYPEGMVICHALCS